MKGPIADRRRMVQGLGAAALLTAGIGCPAIGTAQGLFRADPFTLGVASGDPDSQGFVIWTRLAPAPFDGGGMPSRSVTVRHEIAEDEGFRRIVSRGNSEARPDHCHTVHVDVGGLKPARTYHYRFIAEGVMSPAGRVRTLPAVGAPVARVSFAAVGCQRWEHGYFTAYRHLANEPIDFAFHYGDYIYEYAQLSRGKSKVALVRQMPREEPEARTLADYRKRYAIYKSDPDLQAAHAAFAFIPTFDDHEVKNNWQGQFATNTIEPRPSRAFLARRAAAFQAWYEHMPVRRAQSPRGSSLLAYRRLRVGDLMTLHVLDTRQYRTQQPCGDGWQACPAALDEARTLLGRTQEAWLERGLTQSRTRWNVLAQQVMMMRYARTDAPGDAELHMDRWDGAEAARARLFATIADSRVPGVVTLTGDIHNTWAGNLKRDFTRPSLPNLGVEFVATSISSGGDGSEGTKKLARVASDNPHIRYYNNRRGYMLHTVTRERWQADVRVLERVSTRGGAIATRKALISLRERPGVEDA